MIKEITLGEELFAKGDMEGARNAFDTVLKTNPGCADAHNNLGVLYWQIGEIQTAMDHFTEALEINPDNRDVVVNCAAVLTSQGDIENAAALYKMYLKSHPGDMEIHRLLSDVKSRNNQQDVDNLNARSNDLISVSNNQREGISKSTELPRLFAVISWGHAATFWLSKMLNAHQEVFCVHDIKHQWSQVTNSEKLNDDILYMKVLEKAGLGCRLSGDCHGVNRERIDDIKEVYGERFRSVVIVRHPIPRILSYLSHAEKKGIDNYNLDFEHIENSLDDRLKGRLNTKKQLFFVHVMDCVNIIKYEADLGPLFTMERLTKDTGELNNLLRYLSNGELEFKPAMLEGAFSKQINPHQKCSDHHISVKEIYESLPEWQKKAFSYLLNPTSNQLYQDLGYDLSFIQTNK